MVQHSTNMENVIQFIYKGDTYIKDTNAKDGDCLVGRYALVLNGLDKGKVGTITNYLKGNAYEYVIDGHFHTRKEFSVVLKIESDVYEKPTDFYYNYTIGDGVVMWNAGHEDISKSNNYNDMNIIDKIRVNIKGGPMKTLIKNDILTLDERLTTTGKELFADFLYAKHKDEFIEDLAPKLEGLTLDK